MPFSNYLKNKLLDHSTGKTSYTKPTTYLALLTTLPSDNTGTGLVEMSGGSYARVQIDSSWAAASSGTASTNANIEITCNTGTVVGWAMYDTSTSGNMLAWDGIYTTNTAESNTFATSGEGTDVITLNVTAPVRNVIVKDSSDTTTYTRGTDYTVEYQTGKIIRISAGSISSGATVHVTYDTRTTRSVVAGDIERFNSGNLSLSLEGYK